MDIQKQNFQKIHDKLVLEREALLNSVMTRKQKKQFESIESQMGTIRFAANGIILSR